MSNTQQADPAQQTAPAQSVTKVARRRGGAFRSLFSKMRGFFGGLWHRVRPFVGYPLIYTGVLLMVVFYFTGLTNYNLLLFLPLLLITAGIVGKVALK